LEHTPRLKKNVVLPQSLAALVKRLRSSDGCPWDREQTPASIAAYLAEETYELIDAIASGNTTEICEELGDVLFHVAFLSVLYEEKEAFDLQAVIDRNLEKMIRRHPHVFADSNVRSTDDVRRQWRRIKRQEKRDHPPESILDTVSSGLPPLTRAYRVSQRAAGEGFDWDDLAGVMEKVEEEWAELKAALRDVDHGAGSAEAAAMEFGDVLFTMVNVARLARFRPDSALSAAIRKFEKRFRWMEVHLARRGQALPQQTRRQMDALWEAAKEATT
jgi:tetrapyrrole methylase family protein/MazG family protein